MLQEYKNLTINNRSNKENLEEKTFRWIYFNIYKQRKLSLYI